MRELEEIRHRSTTRSSRRRRSTEGDAQATQSANPPTPLYNNDEASSSSDNDDDDVERGRHYKDHRGRVYGRTCSLGRFFLNPCLCLVMSIQSCRRLRRFIHRPCRVRPAALCRGCIALLQSAWQLVRDPVTLSTLLLIFSFGAVCIVFISRTQQQRQQHPLRRRTDWSVNRTPIRIESFDFANNDDLGGWLGPLPLARPKRAKAVPSKLYRFGGIRFDSLENRPPREFRRLVKDHDYEEYESYRTQLFHDMDQKEISVRYYHDDELDASRCRRNNWQSLQFPTCNAFHEFDIGRPVLSEHAPDFNFDTYYFNHGFYRDAWMVRDLARGNHDKGAVVLKMARYQFDVGPEEFYRTQRDAIIMERLTSSPRIIDVYGHCGTSLTAEPISYEVEEYIVGGDEGYMSRDQLDLLQVHDVQPQNEVPYSATEKLEMALEMAEGIAELHGYAGGVIVHNDIQLCQWLRTADDRLVLGDFNRAQIMMYNDKKGDYCTYTTGKGYGNYRAPEEFAASQLNEKLDVYSMGNNMYVLLTGLWPFYDNEDDGVVQEMVMGGTRPFIDERYRSRSYAESQLVEVMERCFETDPSERASIFEVVERLRAAVKKNRELGES